MFSKKLNYKVVKLAEIDFNKKKPRNNMRGPYKADSVGYSFKPIPTFKPKSNRFSLTGYLSTKLDNI